MSARPGCWIEETHGVPELHTGGETLVRVCCGVNQTVEVDKMYGPLAAVGVRVRLEYVSMVRDGRLGGRA